MSVFFRSFSEWVFFRFFNDFLIIFKKKNKNSHSTTSLTRFDKFQKKTNKQKKTDTEKHENEKLPP